MSYDTPENPVTPWPQKGDHLIANDGLWIYNAWLPGISDLFPHIEGYKRAGDLIWQEIEKNPRGAGIDFLVYPMVFLYRHYTELSIKDIIALGRHLEGSCRGFPTHHRLRELWDEARALIDRIEHGAYYKDIEAMGVLITQFDLIDNGSYAFRYPTTKNQQPSLPGIEYLNLAVFREGIEKMGAFFEGCRAQFEYYTDNLESNH